MFSKKKKKGEPVLIPNFERTSHITAQPMVGNGSVEFWPGWGDDMELGMGMGQTIITIITGEPANLRKGILLAGGKRSQQRGLLRLPAACTIPIRVSDCLGIPGDVHNTLGFISSRACSFFLFGSLLFCPSFSGAWGFLMLASRA